MSNPYYAVYELQGKSLAAAKALDAEVQKDLAKHTEAPNTPNLRAVFLDRMNNDHPDLVAQTGIEHRAICVRVEHDGTQSAYTETPVIHKTPNAEPRFIMYAPIDYKGHHFEPEDAILLDDQMQSIYASGLFAGGWSNGNPVFPESRRITPVPDDFDVQTHRKNPGIKPRTPKLEP